MKRTLTRLTPFFGGAALITSGVVPWLADRVNPLADDSDNLGESLLPMSSTWANVWCVLVGFGLLLAGGAALGRPGTDPRPARRVMTVGAVLGLLTLDHTLLMVAGYLPVGLVFVAMGDLDKLDILLSPGLLVQGLTASAAMVLAWTVLRSWRPAVRPGEDPLAGVARRTHQWTMIAVEAPLAYALSRVFMFLQVPGFDGFEGAILWAGLGLAAASTGGAWLTIGLVRPWGERFPRWVPGLADRRVPVGFAVIPALVVAALVAVASRAIFVGVALMDKEERTDLLAAPLIFLPQLLWPLWAFALAMAALNYRERRRLGEIRTSQAPATS
ncbi:hypothetical protein [Nocardioides jensenii]|uniref:hypothetical protein n=1 Tax=Nocardioides jensenii TaxID=1843 RepID=UPI000836044D|nr:hypothetical protein [Nocardioides jensenii]